MSRKGNCWDNAVAESFFKTIKPELIYNLKFRIIRQAKMAVFEYIEICYNKKRRHSALGYLSPESYNEKLINYKKVLKKCPLKCCKSSSIYLLFSIIAANDNAFYVRAFTIPLKLLHLVPNNIYLNILTNHYY